MAQFPDVAGRSVPRDLPLPLMPLYLPLPEPFLIFQVPLASLAAPVVPWPTSLNEPPLHFQVCWVLGMTSLPVILQVPNGLPL